MSSGEIGNNLIFLLGACRHLSSISWLALICAVLLAAAPVPVRAQQAEIDALASHIAAQIALSKKPRVKKVLVADFLLPNGNLTELGHVWADEFSRSLASVAKGFEVVDRDRLRAIFAEKKFCSAVVRDDDMARWLAELAGAQGILRGYIETSGDSLTLSIAMLWTGRRGERIEAEAKLPRTKEWETLLAREVVPVDEIAPGGSAPVYKAGVGGVSFPQCELCPSPSYWPGVREQEAGRCCCELSSPRKAARLTSVFSNPRHTVSPRKPLRQYDRGGSSPPAHPTAHPFRCA